jgi:hypothetical protein
MKNITFRTRGRCGKLSHPPRSVPPPLLLLPRAAEMGRQTLFEAVPLVPRVLAASHYGSVWKVRAAALVVLWLWVFSRGTGKGPAAVMLVAMLAIGWTYSASGHASAWGDFSLAHSSTASRPPPSGSAASWCWPPRHVPCSSPSTIGRMRSRRPSACRGSRASPSSVSSPLGRSVPERAMGDGLRAALAAQAGRRARHGGARRHQPISRPAGPGPGAAHLPSHSIGRCALPSYRHRGIASGRLGPRVHGASDRREPAAPGIAGRHAPCRRGRGLDSPW